LGRITAVPHPLGPFPPVPLSRPLGYSRSFARRALLVAALWAAAASGIRAETPQEAFQEGYALQEQRRTLEAIDAFQRALRLDPNHGPTHYEIGWSYWLLGDWAQVVTHWEAAERLKAGPPEFPGYLRDARNRLAGKGPPVERVPMRTKAVSADKAAGGLTLELVRRFQHYDPTPDDPADVYDEHVFSPKSVIFSADGTKAYVNALEGNSTIVYDARTFKKRKVIVHRFAEAQAGLFDAAETAAFAKAFKAGRAPANPNRFTGKPVEGELSHGGRYLWVTYYRRDYDRNGVLPSGVGIIDTRKDELVRVMQTGPIPKFLTVSADGRWMAIIHWGDNTVGLIDIGAPDARDFKHAGELVVERRLPLALDRTVDRDRYCGYCLRGAVFTRDSRHLLVGRMGGGGIAVFDVAGKAYLGTVRGMRPTPRHLVLSPDGQRLYLSSNVSGYVSVYRTGDLVQAARAHTGTLAPLIETETGSGTRTLSLSPDGTLIFAAVNRESKIVVLRAETLQPLVEIPCDSYPVGLAASPQGDQVWVTSQGVMLHGGNSVSIYSVSRAP
jgi:DNA-binding beta-propeller fold protein YncE